MNDKEIRVGVAGIITCENAGARRMVLGRRAKEPRLGQWVLPGGKIRYGETMAVALAREFREECGAAVILRPGVFKVYELMEDGDQHRVVIYLIGTCEAAALKAGSDCSEVKGCTLNDLRDLQAAAQITPFCVGVLKDIGWL